MSGQTLSPQSQGTVFGVIRGKAPYILVCLFFFALVATGRALTSREASQITDSRPVSEIVSIVGADFGEVVSQPDFSWGIRLSNNSAKPVHLEFIGTSCACTSVSPNSVTILPYGEQVVTLTMDHGPPRPGDENGRLFAVQLRALLKFEDDSGLSEAEVAFGIHGKIRNMLAMSPSYLDFGEVVRDSPDGGGHKRVVIRSSAPLAGLRVKCDSGNFVCNCEPKVGGDGKLFLVTIRPHVRFCEKVQRIRDKIRLLPVSVSGREFTEQSLMVRCSVVGDIGVRPKSVHFGVRTIGDTSKTAISLYSRDGRPFVVEKVQASLGGPVVTRVNSVRSRPATSHLFQVSQPIENVGIRRSRVSFVVRFRGAARQDVDTVPLVVTYLGRSLPSVRDSITKGTAK